MDKITAVFESRRIPARDARDAVRMISLYAEDENVYIEAASDNSRDQVSKALTEKVWRDQGGPMLF